MNRMRRQLEIIIPEVRIQLNNEHRRVFAEKTLELVFIAAGALIFGQLLGEKEYSPSLAGVGAIILLVAYSMSYYLLRGIRGVSKI